MLQFTQRLTGLAWPALISPVELFAGISMPWSSADMGRGRAQGEQRWCVIVGSFIHSMFKTA